MTRITIFTLALIATLGTACAASSAFWDQKPAAQWSEEEVRRLANNSPWARTTPVIPGKGARIPAAAMPDLTNEARNRNMENNGPGSVHSVPLGGSQPAVERRPTEMTVRWESAAPLTEALATPLPPDLDGHYVLGVVGLPGTDAVATLTVKGQEPLQAGVVHRTRSGEVLFGFSKELLMLSAKDREVEFSLESPLFTLRTKFNLKDMTYRGKPAL